MVLLASSSVFIGSCGHASVGPAELPLVWVDFKTYTTSLEIAEDGSGSAINLAIPAGGAGVCDPKVTRAYSGPISWQVVDEFNIVVEADGDTVYLLAKGSFGEADWGTVYVNPCESDADAPGWETFVGGTGP